MSIEEVSARLGKEKDENVPAVTVNYDFGDDLADAVESFGADVVFERYRSAARVDLQAYMRTLLSRNQSQEQIQEAVNGWKPGVRAQGKTTAEKARDYFGKLTAEEKAALLSELSA